MNIQGAVNSTIATLAKVQATKEAINKADAITTKPIIDAPQPPSPQVIEKYEEDINPEYDDDMAVKSMARLAKSKSGKASQQQRVLAKYRDLWKGKGVGENG